MARWCLIACLLCFGVSAAESDVAAAPPNIVIFYGDDLGWGELGCQGSQDIPTPHIDSIAKNGVRFTQGYVAATYCSPSRAGLMTGKYPTRFGHEFNSVASKTSGLSLQETTIANRLKDLGYATICIGKWHLGAGPDHRPTRRGFDEFYGTLGNTPYFHPTQFIDSRVSNEIQKIEDASFYTTDAYADRAVEWLDAHKSDRKFLYMPFNAQHGPLQAPEKYLARFSHIEDKQRRTFAAILSAMDDAVGRVLTKIRELGQEENTVIFYIADNGGPTKSTTSNNGVLRGFKMNTYEGGPRVPFLMQWKGKLEGSRIYESPVLNLDVLPTVLTAAGATVDAEWKLDGVDLMPFLTGANTSRPHQTLYWRFSPQWAVRHGDMKLVHSLGGTDKPELYDLSKDPGESKDLAMEMPDQVKELQALYDAWDAQQMTASAPKEKPAAQKPKANAGQNKKKKKAAAEAK